METTCRWHRTQGIQVDFRQPVPRPIAVTATKDAFQRNLAYPRAVERPVLVEWQR